MAALPHQEAAVRMQNRTGIVTVFIASEKQRRIRHVNRDMRAFLGKADGRGAPIPLAPPVMSAILFSSLKAIEPDAPIDLKGCYHDRRESRHHRRTRGGATKSLREAISRSIPTFSSNPACSTQDSLRHEFQSPSIPPSVCTLLPISSKFAVR
jgi:hypothetical protein